MNGTFEVDPRFLLGSPEQLGTKGTFEIDSQVSTGFSKEHLSSHHSSLLHSPFPGVVFVAFVVGSVTFVGSVTTAGSVTLAGSDTLAGAGSEGGSVTFVGSVTTLLSLTSLSF